MFHQKYTANVRVIIKFRSIQNSYIYLNFHRVGFGVRYNWHFPKTYLVNRQKMKVNKFARQSRENMDRIRSLALVQIGFVRLRC